MQADAPLLIGIYGPTASGKTALAERIAEAIGAQLINADAFQAYRYLDIGTAKPQRKELYELLDILDPKESFGVGEWALRAGKLLTDLFVQRRNAVAVGGTGLYLRALFEEYAEMAPPPSQELRAALMERERREGLPALAEELVRKNPALAERTDLRNPARVRRALEKVLGGFSQIDIRLPPYRKVKISIDPDKGALNRLIEHRATEMLQNGWVREVNELIRMGYQRDDPAFRAIGYSEVFDFIDQRIGLEQATAKIALATRQYAKRQKTWLRSEPRLNRIAGFGYDSAVFKEAMECLVLKNDFEERNGQDD